MHFRGGLGKDVKQAFELFVWVWSGIENNNLKKWEYKIISLRSLSNDNSFSNTLSS